MNSKSLRKTQRVLVVGSGSTGMVLAAQLASYGVSVRIIDILEKPLNSSKAYTINTRILELLGQIGLTDLLLAGSIKTYSMDYHCPEFKITPKLELADLDSVQPFTLTIGQSVTEYILREYLSSLDVSIEWSTEFKLFKGKGEKIEVLLMHRDNEKRETYEVDWLVGCDGYSSTVSKNLNSSTGEIDFEQCVEMIKVDHSGCKETNEAVHYFTDKDRMLLINRRLGENYRISCKNKVLTVAPNEVRLAFQSFQKTCFASRNDLHLPWSKRIFLAGDAAHINSLAVGQSINLALLDSFNLGWKLALVINGIAKESILDSYETERSLEENQVRHSTSSMHNVILTHSQDIEGRTKRLKRGDWNTQSVNEIAGISYAYSNNRKDTSLTIGGRAPDGLYSKKKRIYELVPKNGFALFLFAGKNPDHNSLKELNRQAQFLEAYSLLSISPYIITCSSQDITLQTTVIVDENDFYKRYQNTPGAKNKLFLIRPDCYIASYGDFNTIKHYLDNNFYLNK